jgi:DNA-binding beta-propeller fold protein YncE
VDRSRLWLSAILLSVVALTLSSTFAYAHRDDDTYRQIALIAIPGAPLTSFDISWVDRSSQRYYLADRSNKAIDVIDARNNTFVSRIGGFVGFTGSNEISGPDGVLVIHSRHELWAGDGDSTVKVIDLETGTIVQSVSTGGTKRADELAFDPKDDVILVANDADDIPFVTFISVADRTVLGRVNLPDATNGLEQPVWDPQTHLFYMSVPQLGANEMHGGIAVMDPRSLSLRTVFPVENCQPAGLALGPHQHLLVGCSQDAIAAGAHAQTIVMNARDGSTVATITEVGGSDQVWYNSGDNRYYLAARGMTSNGLKSGRPTPVLGVIDAEDNTWITNIPTGPNAHSVAANPRNNHIFVPLRGKGVAVFAHNEDNEENGDNED